MTDLFAAFLAPVLDELAAARERVAGAAWELTRPDMRHRLVEIIDPRALFAVGLSTDVARNESTVRVEADPPCYACSLDDPIVHVEPSCVPAEPVELVAEYRCVVFDTVPPAPPG